MNLKKPILHSCHSKGGNHKTSSSKDSGDVSQFLNISPRAPRVNTLEDLQKKQHSNQSDDEQCSEDNNPIQVPIIQLDFASSPLFGQEKGEFIEVKNKKRVAPKIKSIKD